MQDKKKEKTIEEVLEELKGDVSKKAFEIVVHDESDKEHKAIIVMDFNLYRKAYAILMSPKINDKKIDIETDISGAGDKLLFFGWNSGDKVIQEDLLMRIQACNQLGYWFMGIISKANKGQAEKKS